MGAVFRRRHRASKSRGIGDERDRTARFVSRAQISRGTIRPDRLIQSRLSPGASTLASSVELPLSPPVSPPASRARCSRDNENTTAEGKQAKRRRIRRSGRRRGEGGGGEERNARNALHCNFDFIKKWRWNFSRWRNGNERTRAATRRMGGIVGRAGERGGGLPSR